MLIIKIVTIPSLHHGSKPVVIEIMKVIIPKVRKMYSEAGKLSILACGGDMEAAVVR